MKKTIAKLVFILCCIGGIIFLLLPFLETTPPATTDLKSTQPQISSSNPLAAIAKRLGALFGRRNPEREARLLAATPQDRPDYIPPAFGQDAADAPRRATQESPIAQEAGQPTQPDETNVPVPPVPNQEYGDASIQTDNGEWVLVRQTAPQSAEPGMHEINVHEDPYTRYIKQERSRRFHSSVQQQPIPDSKWARFLRPIQSFFGLDEARPVENRAAAIYRGDTTHPRNGTQALAGNRLTTLPARRTRLPWPDISPAQWNAMTEIEREHERERRDTAEFVDLLSGTRSAEEAAAIIAEAQYPDPKDQGKRDTYQHRLTEKHKQQIKEGILTQIRANAEGQKIVDELQEMVGCSNASLPKAGCDPQQQETPRSLFSADELQFNQEANKQTFLEKTQYMMPKDLPLLMVMGPTTPEAVAAMSGLGEVEKTVEIYQFLYEKQNCANQDCFWIPNTIQLDKRLTDAATMANAKLVTDPDNMYPGWANAFEQYKEEKAQQQQNQTANETGTSGTQIDREQVRQEAKKQFTENAVNWIPVTADQLKDIHQHHTLDATNPNNPQTDVSLAIPYVTNPVYAEAVFHAIGDHPTFGYAKEPLTAATPQNVQDLQEADKQTAINTAKLITDSLAENVNTALSVIQGVTQEAVTEGTRAGINQQINQFNQSGQNWNDMLNAVKNRNSGKNSGKK